MRGHRHFLAVGLLTVALCAPALAVPEVVQLGGAVGDDPIAACRNLAAPPFDPNADGPGLKDEQVFLDGATAACEAALAATPDAAQVQAWLARVHILAGRLDAARPLLERSIEAGNPLAAYLLSGLLGRPLNGAVEEDPDRALALLMQAAEGGYAPAQLDLAGRYETAAGVEGSYEEALRLYELASDTGLGAATYKMGLFYLRGFGVAPDLDRAAQLYERAIEQGEPLGNTGLGDMYQFGEGKPQDYAKAAEYYQLAADGGEKTAQTSLAYLYEQGLGVPQDFDKSFALLQEAVAQDWAFAKAALSIHYLFGQGTPIDNEKAFSLAIDAAGAGVAYAQGILGYLYQQGLGTVRDLSSALYRFQQGAEQGDQFSANQISVVEAEIACRDAAAAPFEPGNIGGGVALDAIDTESAIATCENAVNLDPIVGNRVWLARAYVAAGYYEEAVPLLEEGVAAGNVLAHVVLGDMLVEGRGIDADPARAVTLYQSVASDFALAQYALGLAYANGTGVEADRAKAMEWFRMAEMYGLPEATEQIGVLQALPDPNAIDLTGFGREGPGY